MKVSTRGEMPPLGLGSGMASLAKRSSKRLSSGLKCLRVGNLVLAGGLLFEVVEFGVFWTYVGFFGGGALLCTPLKGIVGLMTLTRKEALPDRGAFIVALRRQMAASVSPGKVVPSSRTIMGLYIQSARISDIPSQSARELGG